MTVYVVTGWPANLTWPWYTTPADATRGAGGQWRSRCGTSRCVRSPGVCPRSF